MEDASLLPVVQPEVAVSLSRLTFSPVGMRGLCRCTARTFVEGYSFRCPYAFVRKSSRASGTPIHLVRDTDKTVRRRRELMPQNPRLSKFFKVINLEHGLILGIVSLLVGVLLLLLA